MLWHVVKVRETASRFQWTVKLYSTIRDLSCCAMKNKQTKEDVHGSLKTPPCCTENPSYYVCKLMTLKRGCVSCCTLGWNTADRESTASVTFISCPSYCWHIQHIVCKCKCQRTCKIMRFYKPKCLSSVLLSTPNNQNILIVQLNDCVDVV